jgi:lysophospholipase L1-like esterase
MRLRRNYVRTILYNVLIFFIIANVIYWLIPIVGTILREGKGLMTIAGPISPSYSAAEAAWVRTYQTELRRVGFKYRSHIGWRRDTFEGERINIGGRYLQRRTLNDKVSGQRKAYFFGGSTMWAEGSDDAGTIPSQFAAVTGIHSENFGETAYDAHQGLSLLIQVLQAGHRPDLVVFYDGVNDVINKCRQELTPESHALEQRFEQVLRRSGIADSFSYYFSPILTVVQNVKREGTRAVQGEEHDCHRNPEKAEAIAKNLVRDWDFAKHLVEWHGGKFIGVLQPVAYFSRTRLDHVSLSRNWERQYRTVYPLIQKKLIEAGGYYDLTSALDIDDFLYLDFCHLGPKGNLLMAKKIAEIAGPLGPSR